MLSGRDERQIFQTVAIRLRMNEYGPPDSFSAEEKEFYTKTEKELVENKKKGINVVYDFPNDYD